VETVDAVLVGGLATLVTTLAAISRFFDRDDPGPPG
jgi:hypothetical protein